MHFENILLKKSFQALLPLIAHDLIVEGLRGVGMYSIGNLNKLT